jgi:hypothetical protein
LLERGGREAERELIGVQANQEGRAMLQVAHGVADALWVRRRRQAIPVALDQHDVRRVVLGQREPIHVLKRVECAAALSDRRLATRRADRGRGERHELQPGACQGELGVIERSGNGQ